MPFFPQKLVLCFDPIDSKCLNKFDKTCSKSHQKERFPRFASRNKSKKNIFIFFFKQKSLFKKHGGAKEYQKSE
jgi:hypothetical protein